MTYRVVVSTINAREAAERLARALLEARLVACVNIVGPITSLYHWQGGIEQDEEYLLLMKTAASVEDALMARIHELHPYEEPEVLVLPVVAGAPSYLAWIAESIQKH
jgi:periplasmic divalent cation tolerance protein